MIIKDMVIMNIAVMAMVVIVKKIIKIKMLINNYIKNINYQIKLSH
jgi:hypothetical protein